MAPVAHSSGKPARPLAVRIYTRTWRFQFPYAMPAAYLWHLVVGPGITAVIGSQGMTRRPETCELCEHEVSGLKPMLYDVRPRVVRLNLAHDEPLSRGSRCPGKRALLSRTFTPMSLSDTRMSKSSST
ncbi:hypothetical protein BDV06DRAFT_24648 [Aspergillus oleicola]